MSELDGANRVTTRPCATSVVDRTSGSCGGATLSQQAARRSAVSGCSCSASTSAKTGPPCSSARTSPSPTWSSRSYRARVRGRLHHRGRARHADVRGARGVPGAHLQRLPGVRARNDRAAVRLLRDRRHTRPDGAARLLAVTFMWLFVTLEVGHVQQTVKYLDPFRVGALVTPSVGSSSSSSSQCGFDASRQHDLHEQRRPRNASATRAHRRAVRSRRPTTRSASGWSRSPSGWRSSSASGTASATTSAASRPRSSCRPRSASWLRCARSAPRSITHGLPV